jgi:hypothetical protein
MVQLQTKNTNFGKFWRALASKRLVSSMAIWSTLRPFGKFYGHLVIYWQFSPVLVYCRKKNLAALFTDPAAEFVPCSRSPELTQIRIFGLETHHLATLPFNRREI